MCVGRPYPEPIAWDNEPAFEAGEDMYALADESREMLLDLYRKSWAFSDQNIRELGLDARADVPWWPEDRTPHDARLPAGAHALRDRAPRRSRRHRA